MCDGDIAGSRPGLRQVRTRGIDQYPLVFKLGKIHLDRIIKLEFASLIQLQHCSAGDLSGHGIKAEQGIIAHRLALLQVQLPQCLEVD